MDAYLELIRLARFFLQDQIPQRRLQSIQEKPLQPPPDTPLRVVEEKKNIQKPVKVERNLDVKTSPIPAEKGDQSEIATLIKTHFPYYSLKDQPLRNTTDIIILTADESAEEKQLLINIAQALHKQGFSSELVHLLNYDLSLKCKAIIMEKRVLKNAAYLHPKIRKETPHIYLNETTLFLIPSLQEFIETPSIRITWWSHLQKQIKA